MTRAFSDQEDSSASPAGKDACAPRAMNLSVAMCTYLGERFLGEQLESISAQTRLSDELVICDDGSTDGTRQIVEDYASKAPFQVRVVVNPKNVGPAANFGGAISLCKGFRRGRRASGSCSPIHSVAAASQGGGCIPPLIVVAACVRWYWAEPGPLESVSPARYRLRYCNSRELSGTARVSDRIASVGL